MELNELKIEVGKKYVSRGGHIATIDQYLPYEKFCFKGTVRYKKTNKLECYSWLKDGKFMGGADQNLDLISEYIEEIELVVGEKYSINGFCYSPYLFIADLRDFNHKTDKPLIFINKGGISVELKLDILSENRIKAFIEKPQPYEVVSYASYDPGYCHRNALTDKCTDLYVTNLDKDYDLIKAHAREYKRKVARITCKVELDYQGE